MHSTLAHLESGPAQLIGKSTANLIGRESYVPNMQRHRACSLSMLQLFDTWATEISLL